MAMTTTDGALVVGPSIRAQLGTIGILLALVAVYVVAAVFGILPLPIVVGGGLCFAVGLWMAAVVAFRSRHVQWDLKLDAKGVSVRDRGSYPWTDVAEVTVSPLWSGPLRRLAGGYRVLAFHGRHGVTLPSLPSTDLPAPLQGWAERRRLALVGSLLIVPPRQMDTSHAEIEAAVRRYSDVPIHHGIARRPSDADD